MANFSCGLAYMTALSLSDVEGWLESNCPGDWTVRLADGENPLAQGRKKIEVLFETREDMATFKARFKTFEEQRASSGGGRRGGESSKKDAKKKPSSGMLRPDQDKGF